MGRPYVRGSDTSRAAAASVEHSAKAQQSRCLQLIKDSGYTGKTCDEIEEILGERHQAISARLRELVLSERIIDTGSRRPTRSGRNANVYRFVK